MSEAESCNFQTDCCKFFTALLLLKSLKDFHSEFSYCMFRIINTLKNTLTFSPTVYLRHNTTLQNFATDAFFRQDESFPAG